MIDGFTLRVTDPSTIQKILNHPKLEFTRKVYVRTGEAKPAQFAKYKGLRFEYVETNHWCHVFIRGNMPFYCTGKSNYTNLPLTKVLQGFIMLASEFELDLETTLVIKLEWGLNFTLPEEITVSRFLDNIMVYKGKLPKDIPYPENGGRMILFKLKAFDIKVYDKGAQQGIDSNVVRCELAVVNKAMLNRLHIHALKDLFEEKGTQALQKSLLETANHLVFYDHVIDLRNIPRKRKIAFYKLKHRSAWVEMKKTQNELYRKKRKLFTGWMTEASGIDWNQLLSDSVIGESNQLLRMNTEANRMSSGLGTWY